MGIQSDIAGLAELKRLAEAIHGKGTTFEMLNRWAAFESACKPDLILALIAETEALRQAVGFAEEAFRTITSADGSGHADLSRAVLRIAGPAMAQAAGAVVVACPPENCRQRIAASGKPYPRSSCASCGQFSPKWRECDALIAVKNIGASE